MSSDRSNSGGAGVAIIAMTGRFPGAGDLDAYWRNLRDGVESITRFSDKQLHAAGVLPESVKHPSYVKARGIIDDVELFDASFFGYSPSDALFMDPQQRLFLQSAWEALELAGYDPRTHHGLIGVYAGASRSSYESLIYQSLPTDQIDGVAVALGNELPYLPARVSYKLDLKGPSYPVQTACSTSLVAVHLACQGLLNAECDMAIAGGVSIRLPQTSGYRYQEDGIFSPDGRCRPFDAESRGTLFSNGIGLVVLKRLDDALADGDSIRAVIRGSAVNNDGARRASFTAPGVVGQTNVIADALAAGEIDSRTIGYVEAHGTATTLGDSIEIQALTRAFGNGFSGRQFCAIGSVKGNIGHLDAAAGIAGLIKTVLALEHRELPPTLHFERPNPDIRFESTPFYVNAALRAWPQHGAAPRRAGVSSFGFGGTNAHVVLEEGPQTPSSGVSREVQLIPVSAETQEGLERATTRLFDYLQRTPQIDLADAAYTLKVGRRSFRHRRAIVCRDVREGVGLLEAQDRRFVLNGQHDGPERSVVFLLPAEADRIDFGVELYDREPEFRAVVEDCARRLLPHAGFDLRTLLHAARTGADNVRPPHAAGVIQPALFVLEYALAHLWMSWGVKPEACVGLGIGEYVAACLAGVLPLDAGLRLAALRGRLMQAAEEAPTDDGMEPLVQAAAGVHFETARIPYLSSVTGRWIVDAQIRDPKYWGRQTRAPLRLSPDACEFLRREDRAFLELGPGPVLGRRIEGGGGVCVEALPESAGEVPELPFMLAALGRLWLSGVRIDWSGFHAHEQRRRVPLPTYPFERRRFAVTPPSLSRAATRAAGRTLATRNPDVRDWFYAPIWTQAPLPVPLAAPVPAGAAGRWLVFVDECGVGQRIADRLEYEGHDVSTVVSGDRFSRPGNGTAYTIDPQSSRDYERLIEKAGEGGLTGIFHAWGVSPAGDPSKPIEYEFEHERVCGSVLLLAQAIGQTGIGAPVRLNIVTTGVQEVLGIEALSPGRATVLGLRHVIAQEYPHLICKAIDLDDPAFGGLSHGKAATLEQVLHDGAADFSASVVAYRAGYRWAQRYSALQLPEPTGVPARLRAGGMYLITGGLGELGLAIAEYLARTVRARLALVGRSSLPAEAEWDRYLASHDAGDPMARRIVRIRNVRSHGAQVLVLRADVADHPQMADAFAAAERQFGRVDGVIHAAGLTSGDTFKSIAEGNTDQWWRQFHAKVVGLTVIDELVRHRDLDFCLLVSSLSAVLGGLGYGAYASANVFLDAVARLRNRTSSFPWLSINWDTWLRSEEEARLKQVGASPVGYVMTPQEGIDALHRILSADVGVQIAVSTGDLQNRLEQWVSLRLLRDDTDGAAEPRAFAGLPRPNLPTEYVAPTGDVERAITEAFRRGLGLEQVGVHDNFFELGGHSLKAIEISARLQSQLGTDVRVTMFYEAPTAALLAGAIESRRVSSGSDEVDRRVENRLQRLKLRRRDTPTVAVD